MRQHRYRAQFRDWLSRPDTTVSRSQRRRRVVLSLAAAGSLLPGTLLALAPVASAAASAYAVTEVPLGTSTYNVVADPATNTIYAATNGGVDVIDGASKSLTLQVGTGFVVGAIAVDSSSSSDTVYAFSVPEVATVDAINGATDTVTTTISLPIAAAAAVADPGTHLVYAVAAGGTAVVINGLTDAVTWFQLPGSHPADGMVMDATTHTLYVADDAKNQVDVIDGATDAVTARIALPAGSVPAGLAMDSAAGLVYIADKGTGAISVIHTATNGVTTLATGLTQPTGLAFDSGSDTLYAASAQGSADAMGTTYVINAGSGVVADQIPRGGSAGAVAGGSAYVSGSPGALVDDVTAMTPSATTTMSPVIVNDLPSSLTFTVGQAVQDQMTANATPAATFSATGLPSGLTVSGDGLLSGTPAGGTGGEYFPVVTAANGIAPPAVSDVGFITVDQAPAITSADQVSFTAGLLGNFSVTANGFPSSTFSETGALPQGVGFANNATQAIGVLSGIPAEGTAGTYPIELTATNGTGTATQAFVLTVDSGSLFVPVGPVRVLDTRNGTGGFSGPIGPGGVLSLPVAGVAGVPASGVTAVVLNVTVTQPTAAFSYLAVYPDGQTHTANSPSNLNFTAGETIPNLVTVPVGADGKVDFYNNLGTTHLVVDLEGYYTSSGAGSSYLTDGPVRVLDTRNGTGTGGFISPVGQAGVLTLPVEGRDGVPPGVTAVVLNVTVTQPTAAFSYLAVYPDGQTHTANSPSNLNYTAGETIPNLVVVPVGADGNVDFYNNLGTTHLVVDLEGYYTTSGLGALFVPMGPVRVLDTRNGTGGFSGPVGQAGVLTLPVEGVAGVPATGVTATVLNVTVTQPTAAFSYLSVYPDGQTHTANSPSNLNYTSGETIPNLVVVPVGADGKVDFYNNLGTTHLVVDLEGYFTTSP